MRLNLRKAALFSMLFSMILAAAPWCARAEEGDPPTRVARISYLKGSVSFQPSGAGEWTGATLNRPLTIGDRLWTDSDARAELQAGAAAIHLDHNTAVSFLNLDDRTIQVRLTEGAIHFRVRELRDAEIYEVDTPNLAFTITRAGAFRVDVNEAGNLTRVTVFRGEGEITGGGRTYPVRAGERAEFTGTDALRYDISPATDPDKFDRWAMDRDLKEERAVSSRYVSRDVIGYQDLDDYGYWRDDAAYGHVWYPRYVSYGWAPYRYGRWVWIAPWGWTWVDDAPWGFAPFHYGRWAYINGYWGWCPGPYYVRPVYAPAFVAFLGGRHFGFAFGFGHSFAPVGWFPLAPGEVFFPGFRASRTFIQNINVTNTTINNITVINDAHVRNTRFVNQHVAGGVTAVPQDAFVNSRSVSRAALRVPAKALDDAEVLHEVSVAPSQRSVLGAATPAALRVPPERIQNRPVVARATPAPASVQDVRKFNPREFNTLGNDAHPGSPARSAFVPQTALVRPAAPANPPAAITPVRPGIIVRPGVGDANPMERRFSPRELELQHDKPLPGVRGGVQERISEERIHPTRPTRPDDAPRNLDRPAPPRADRPPVEIRPPHSAEKPVSPPAPRSAEPQRPARPERPPQADRPSESNRPPDRPSARAFDRPAFDRHEPRDIAPRQDRVAREPARSSATASPRFETRSDFALRSSAPQSSFVSRGGSSASPRSSAGPRSSPGGSSSRSGGRFSSGSWSRGRD